MPVQLFVCTRTDPISLRRIIQELTTKIVTNIGALYKASEAVALLDVLWSFAHASIGVFIKPRQELETPL